MRRRCAAVVLAAIAALSCHRRTAEDLERQDRLRSPEEWLRSEPVRLLRDYVRIDTTDARGEREGVLFLKALLDCPRVESEVVCPAPGRCNLLARLPGRRHDGALLLLSHADVADAFPTLWKEATPFSGAIKLGFLYGRGAYDMKSIALAQVLAIRDIALDGIVPEHDILLLAEADEEGKQEWGSRWLLDHRPEWFAGVAAVLNEGGTNEMILRQPRFFGVETLQAGYGLLELESGKAEPLRALAEKWRKLAGETVAPHPHVVRGFDMLANHLPPPLSDSLRSLDRVRRTPAELATLPDRYASFLERRVWWTQPYAFPPGETGNFRAYAVVSTPPGIDPGPDLDRIAEDARASGVRIVSRTSSGPTAASPYPTPMTELLRRSVEARFPGVPFEAVPTFGGMTTSVEFRRRGIPTYGFSPIPFNITDAARRHGNDERIYLRDFIEGVEAYRDLVADFAASPETLSRNPDDPTLARNESPQ